MSRLRREPQSLGAAFMALGGVIDVAAKTISTTTEEKDHAEFSASGSQRWLNCPGSMALCKRAPPARESKYAAEGTEAHACLEFLLRNRRKLAQAIEVAYTKYPADMVDHAEGAAAYVLERLKDAGRDAELLVETRVDSSPFTCAGQFGTLDVAIVNEFSTLVVMDFKYGAGVAVDPGGEDGLGNSQLVYYGLGISYMYHHNFADVELVVIQPRAYHESGETIRSFHMSMAEMLAWVDVFKLGVEATREPDAPLAPGKWCKFCQAATICPEIRQKSMATARIVFDDNKVDGLILPEVAPSVLPNLANLLPACDRLEAWIEKVRDHAYSVLARGGEIPGYKLVNKRSPRRWRDKENAEISAAVDFGDMAFTKPKLISPAQLEKAVGKNKVAAFLKAHTTAESTGTTMVSAKDKRPAVRRIDDIFSDLDNIFD